MNSFYKKKSSMARVTLSFVSKMMVQSQLGAHKMRYTCGFIQLGLLQIRLHEDTGSGGSMSSSKGAIYMFHIFSGNFRQLLRIID